MALLTGGTNASTSLAAIKFLPGYGSGMSAANIALMALSIKDDLGNAHSIWPGAFSANGKLYIPNRGVLTMLPGDYVMTDSTTGWPILLSARAIASGPWSHS